MNDTLKIKEIIVKDDLCFQLVGVDKINNSRLNRRLERYKSYFQDFDNKIFNVNINYVELEYFIEQLNKVLNDNGFNSIELSSQASDFIEEQKYLINEHRIAGLTIKDYGKRWEEEFHRFKMINDQEMNRKLLGNQYQASFFLAMMKKADNFSVPGAGKTAMTYGAFAYLSSNEIRQVNKILIVCPLNAFEAWRYEFIQVFNLKRDLYFMNLKDKKYKEDSKIRLDWLGSNVIVINYESLGSKLKVLNELIDNKTMLVFDEVHRVKNPSGTRAKNTLLLGRNTNYRYV